VVIVVLAVELYAVYAVLHPRVSPGYRAYYIDHITKDWNVPHYPATPAEGIVFGKPGWPDFVRFSSGFSFQEDWGRWTDADLQPTATIFMSQKFSGPLCIEFFARPSVSQRGQKVDVGLGNNVGQVILADPDYTTYRVSFADARPADTLEFRFEDKVAPNNEVTHSGTDGRRLGMGIIWLKILPSVCKKTS
jgi:phosphoglycerol transferase